MNAQQEIERLRNQISSLESQQNNCRHQWGETVADHIYEKAYTIPGDVPGTMGIDWRGPVWVPAKTIERWKRVCKLCGKIEYTNRKEQVRVEYKPVFN